MLGITIHDGTIFSTASNQTRSDALQIIYLMIYLFVLLIMPFLKNWITRGNEKLICADNKRYDIPVRI
jgi:hypothetical protein